MITVAGVAIHPRSKGTLAVEATLRNDGDPSRPLSLTGHATGQGAPLPHVIATPVPIESPPGGSVTVTLVLRFVPRAARAPLRLTSDGVDLQLAGPDGGVLARTHVDYIRDWYPDLPDVRPTHVARLPYAPVALDFDTIRAAYDGDEDGSLVFARTRRGRLIGLVVRLEPPPGTLEVVRWFDFSARPPARAAGRPARPGYRVAPGQHVDLARGRVAADPDHTDVVWERASGAPPALRLRPLPGATLTTVHVPVMLPLAATRVFARGNPREGTQRDWTEIRDLFDNCNEEPYRAGFCVDNVWAPAGIEFRIVVRRDIHVPDNWAHELPEPTLHAFGREHNLPRLLNVYFCRSVEGARAWGAPDVDLRLLGQQGALWVGDRCEDERTASCWTADVITAAHEAGHFLGLTHRCDDTQGRPCRAGDAAYLMYGDGTGPQSRRLTPAEIVIARRRAWLYRP